MVLITNNLKMNIPMYIHYIILGLGVINTIIGIIAGIIKIINQKNLKIKDFKNSIIFFLVGLVLILLFIIFKPECKHPEIKIKSLSDCEKIDEDIDIKGNASCLASDAKIAILIHQFEQDNIQERWFIHAECASIEGNNSWKFTNVEVGTSNMKGKKFEIFTYAINDSICEIIHRKINKENYHGSSQKPAFISGVFDRKIVIRK